METIAAEEVIGGYEFLEKIGAGKYSSVYRVRSLQHGLEFCGKVIPDNSVEARASFEVEVKALTELNHPNIIKVYQQFQSGSRLILIEQYCHNGSLAEYVARNGPLTGLRLVKATKEICSALTFAWTCGISHRSIRPQNLFLDDEFRIRVGGWGGSLHKCNSERRSGWVREFEGLVEYMAPEMLERWFHDPIQSDIWALGVTLIVLMTGELPWGTTDPEAIKEMVLQATWEIPATVTGEMRKIVGNMMRESADVRIVPRDIDLDQVLVSMPGVHGGELVKKSASIGRMGMSISSRSVLVPRVRGGRVIPRPVILSPMLNGQRHSVKQ